MPGALEFVRHVVRDLKLPGDLGMIRDQLLDRLINVRPDLRQVIRVFRFRNLFVGFTVTDSSCHLVWQRIFL